MPASPLCCVRWSLAGSGSCPPGERRPRLQAQLPLQHHRAALPWLLPSVTYELVHLLTSFPFAIRIKANLSEHTTSFLILHLRVQRSQSSVWHSRALYVPSCRKYPALIPAPPPQFCLLWKQPPRCPVRVWQLLAYTVGLLESGASWVSALRPWASQPSPRSWVPEPPHPAVSRGQCPQHREGSRFRGSVTTLWLSGSALTAVGHWTDQRTRFLLYLRRGNPLIWKYLS